MYSFLFLFRGVDHSTQSRHDEAGCQSHYRDARWWNVEKTNRSENIHMSERQGPLRLEAVLKLKKCVV